MARAVFIGTLKDNNNPKTRKGNSIMETQTQITWKASGQSDWTGIELIDSETGETHATIDGCTPEALALIVNAPELLEVLREIQTLTNRKCRQERERHHGWEPVAVDRLEEIAMKARQAIAKAEGGEA